MNLLPALFVLLLVLLDAKADYSSEVDSLENEDALWEEEEAGWERYLGGNDDLSQDDDPYADDAPAPAPAPTPATICFSRVSTVEESTRGRLAMENLKVGDKILTRSGRFQTVFAFAHKQEEVTGSFLQFHARELDNPLEVTDDHLIYLHNKKNPVRAASVQVGDELDTTFGPAKIQKVTTVQRKGVYAPMTADGTLVVDSVAASNYISFQNHAAEEVEIMGIKTGLSHHDYVHMGMSPFRLICLGISSKFAEWVDEETGMPMHVSLGVKTNMWMFQQNIFVQSLLFSIILLVHAICFLLELILGPRMAPFVVLTMGTICYLKLRQDKAKRIKTL